jgi:hypothetical protein
VVSGVERVLAVAGDVAVVALCTRDDKALVDAAVRAGAAGSLDRAASDIDTITALHVYRDRQHGAKVDMRLAEPPAETPGLRVSGALPRFPTAAPAAAYANDPPPQGEPPPSEVAAGYDPPQGTEQADAVGGELESVDEELKVMRDMLRSEAAAAASKAPKRKIGGLFRRRKEKEPSWGPQQGGDKPHEGDKEDADEETRSS